MSAYKPQHLIYHPEEEAFVIYQLQPQRTEELLATSVDIRYPFGITFTSFLCGYLDREATAGRKRIYILTMCLGLFLLREGMRRELNLARSIERLVVEAEEGKQLKLVTVRGKQKVLGFKDIQRWTGDAEKEGQAFIGIKDPENPKSWFEFDTEHAAVFKKALITVILDGKYDSLETN